MKAKYRSDTLNDRCKIITHFYSGLLIKIQHYDSKYEPELKLVNTDTGTIFTIEGMPELKKLKRLLEEYIELSEETILTNQT